MNRSIIVIATTAALLTCASDAQAYFDPGTGSVILQAVIAAVAAASIGARTFWSQLKAFFRRDKSVDAAPDVDKRD